MNLGIIGLGSIGRKHAQVIQDIGGHKVYALRSNKGSLTTTSEELSFVNQIFSKEEFAKIDLDGLLICTPTHLHSSNLIDFENLQIPVLVEKPLSHSFTAIPSISKNYKSKIKVAFCLRFHPIVNKVKTLIEKGELGKVLKANLTVGQYLPTWHPYTDYRNEYFSKSSMGGGALRTLSHELDLALHWFGKFTKLSGVVNKLSNLEIDVDDNTFILSKHKNGAYINMTIDFLSPKVKRFGYILCEKGEIHYDMISSSLSINYYHKDESEIIPISKNEMYSAQMKDFISFINHEPSLTASFSEAEHIMRVIDAAEQSSLQSKTIQII